MLTGEKMSRFVLYVLIIDVGSSLNKSLPGKFAVFCVFVRSLKSYRTLSVVQNLDH